MPSGGGEALSAVMDKVGRRWVVPTVVGLVILVIMQLTGKSELAVNVDMPAPDFALEATDNTMFTLSRLRGTPIILSFWATDCPDCISELPEKTRFSKSHPEVQLLGIAVDSGGLEALATAKAELGISYPVVESNRAIESAYGVSRLPLTLLIDDKGIIRQIREGPISKQKLTIWTR